MGEATVHNDDLLDRTALKRIEESNKYIAWSIHEFESISRSRYALLMMGDKGIHFHCHKGAERSAMRLLGVLYLFWLVKHPALTDCYSLTDLINFVHNKRTETKRNIIEFSANGIRFNLCALWFHILIENYKYVREYGGIARFVDIIMQDKLDHIVDDIVFFLQILESKNKVERQLLNLPENEGYLQDFAQVFAVVFRHAKEATRQRLLKHLTGNNYLLFNILPRNQVLVFGEEDDGWDQIKSVIESACAEIELVNLLTEYDKPLILDDKYLLNFIRRLYSILSKIRVLNELDIKVSYHLLELLQSTKKLLVDLKDLINGTPDECYKAMFIIEQVIKCTHYGETISLWLTKLDNFIRVFLNQKSVPEIIRQNFASKLHDYLIKPDEINEENLLVAVDYLHAVAKPNIPKEHQFASIIRKILEQINDHASSCELKLQLEKDIKYIIDDCKTKYPLCFFYINLYKTIRTWRTLSENQMGIVLNMVCQIILHEKGFELETKILDLFIKNLDDYLTQPEDESINNNLHWIAHELEALGLMILQSQQPQIIKQQDFACTGWVELLEKAGDPLILLKLAQCKNSTVVRLYEPSKELLYKKLLPKYQSIRIIIMEIEKIDRQLAAKLTTVIDDYFKGNGDLDVLGQILAASTSTPSDIIALFREATKRLPANQDEQLRLMDYVAGKMALITDEILLPPSDLSHVRQILPTEEKPRRYSFNGNVILCLPQYWANCNVKVVGDIHGNLAIVNDIAKFLAADGNNRVICVGDYINRGYMEVWNQLMELEAEYGERLILPRGNHEQAVLEPDNPEFKDARYGDFYWRIIKGNTEQKVFLDENKKQRCVIPLRGDKVTDPATFEKYFQRVVKAMPMGVLLPTGEDGEAILITHGALLAGDQSTISESLFKLLMDKLNLLTIYSYSGADLINAQLQKLLLKAGCKLLICGHSHFNGAFIIQDGFVQINPDTTAGFVITVNSALFSSLPNSMHSTMLLIQKGEIESSPLMGELREAEKFSRLSRELEKGRSDIQRGPTFKRGFNFSVTC